MIRQLRNTSQNNDPSKTEIISPKRSSVNSLFEETSYRAIKVAQRRKWTFIGSVLFVLVLGVSFIIYNNIAKNKESKLAAEFASIDMIYNQENLAFQKLAEAAKDKLPQDASPDYSNSMALFAQYALDHPAEPSGWQAAVRAASYFMTKGQNIKAKEVLESIESYVNKFPLVEIRVRTALASLYAEEQNSQKAIEELKRVEEIPSNPLPNQARLLKGQILFLSGNKPEAQKVFNQIISTTSEASSLDISGQTSQIQQQAKIWLSYIDL
ncbi:tetratricopeptide repeat protein [Fluviispira multicolorata]|uniref:Tetratricopeptide repeat protein n=1 Tax=Fluviispira multicolorata TaxID=2654512 RepID=A0A833N344_9BACT|nr:tetratricopeptide repeat protein [Fluviispira multicolorata]KAB8027749.1 tetratricopeptide repeat protein [Fluviispira multicolorata]